ncbi:MAG TPA: hypothetical protein VJ719_10095 [Chthoniobacterales bacterium]|nr:hypothetical protein [Chthoniobacterales bacterium]
MKTRGFLLSTLAFLLSSCANQHFRVPAEGPPPAAPRSVELLREKQIANLHFPAGVYSFYAMDDKGFYYQSTRPIVQHGTGSSSIRQGGVFVNRRHLNKLRGYVFLAGAITHVGDLSRVPHQYRH